MSLKVHYANLAIFLKMQFALFYYFNALSACDAFLQNRVDLLNFALHFL